MMKRLLPFLLVLVGMLPASHAYAAVAFVNSNIFEPTVAGSKFSVTVAGCSTSNAGLVLGIFGNQGSLPAVSGVVNGVAMQEIYVQSGISVTGFASAWFLAGATSSSQFFTGTITGTSFANIYAACYSGVAQTNSIEATSTSNFHSVSTSATFTTTVTINTVGAVVAQLFGVNSLAPTSGTNDTVRQYDSNQGWGGSDGGAFGSTGSQTMTLTSSGTPSWGGIWFAMDPAPTPGTTIPSILYLLGAKWW